MDIIANKKYSLGKVEDIRGFAMTNANQGEKVTVLTSACITSDHPNFYHYIEKFSNLYLKNYTVDNIYRFLIVIHEDLQAEAYVNEMNIHATIMSKRDVKQYEVVYLKDMSDIISLHFPDIEFKETDKIIFCFKAKWKFGLYFDLSQRVQLPFSSEPIKIEKLNVDEMGRAIAGIQRYLYFTEVYQALEAQPHYQELLHDGWFPFIEIMADEFVLISAIYSNKFDHQKQMASIVNRFGPNRISNITDKWWKSALFKGKEALVKAGINAYLQDTEEGFINCIKNLWTEVEGVLRALYQIEAGPKARTNSKILIHYIIERVKKGVNSDSSLFFPSQFLDYLEKVVFASFDITTGQISMSRNSSSHGVADASQYTKDRALQLILVLDQIYYYLNPRFVTENQ